MKPIKIALWTTQRATVKLRVDRFENRPNGIKATVRGVVNYQGHDPEKEIFRDEVSLWKLKNRVRFAQAFRGYCYSEDLLPPNLIAFDPGRRLLKCESQIEKKLVELEDVLLRQQEQAPKSARHRPVNGNRSAGL